MAVEPADILCGGARNVRQHGPGFRRFLMRFFSSSAFSSATGHNSRFWPRMLNYWGNGGTLASLAAALRDHANPGFFGNLMLTGLADFAGRGIDTRVQVLRWSLFHTLRWILTPLGIWLGWFHTSLNDKYSDKRPDK